jgi:hypothetical protein
MHLLDEEFFSFLGVRACLKERVKVHQMAPMKYLPSVRFSILYLFLWSMQDDVGVEKKKEGQTRLHFRLESSQLL